MIYSSTFASIWVRQILKGWWSERPMCAENSGRKVSTFTLDSCCRQRGAIPASTGIHAERQGNRPIDGSSPQSSSLCPGSLHLGTLSPYAERQLLFTVWLKGSLPLSRSVFCCPIAFVSPTVTDAQVQCGTKKSVHSFCFLSWRGGRCRHM